MDKKVILIIFLILGFLFLVCCAATIIFGVFFSRSVEEALDTPSDILASSAGNEINNDLLKTKNQSGQYPDDLRLNSKGEIEYIVDGQVIITLDVVEEFESIDIVEIVNDLNIESVDRRTVYVCYRKLDDSYELGVRLNDSKNYINLNEC